LSLIPRQAGPWRLPTCRQLHRLHWEDIRVDWLSHLKKQKPHLWIRMPSTNKIRPGLDRDEDGREDTDSRYLTSLLDRNSLGASEAAVSCSIRSMVGHHKSRAVHLRRYLLSPDHSHTLGSRPTLTRSPPRPQETQGTVRGGRSSGSTFVYNPSR
jgi:hypothetical protein